MKEDRSAGEIAKTMLKKNSQLMLLYDVTQPKHALLISGNRAKKTAGQRSTAVLFHFWTFFRSPARRKKPKRRTPGAGTPATTSLDPDIASSSSLPSSSSSTRVERRRRLLRGSRFLFLFFSFALPSRTNPPSSTSRLR